MEVKLCIVCDSAVAVDPFVALALHVVQPIVYRLQEKHPGCKLAVGLVTYTTPTTRPAIITRKAFGHANAVFPFFKSDPHSLGIGTSGTGGTIGMAVLEGLVAAIEVCSDAVGASHSSSDLFPHCRCVTKLSKLLLDGCVRATQALSNLNNTSHLCFTFCSSAVHVLTLRVAHSAIPRPP